MIEIYKITENQVVDFAAEELKKYLRMMMPDRGNISIKYYPEADVGFRLGVMSDFSIDTSEADDIELDDIIHIDTDSKGGIISGSNPRSVLLAVYRFLRENGCFWLFPGVDGEYIPQKDIEGVTYHKMADCRYRGQCNEGAEFQQSMLDVIDFQPKLGMNVFMIEFDNPRVYYNLYYNASHNETNRQPEYIDPTTTKQWKRQCETELEKRGLQFHDMGHGWTAEPFGISSINGWAKNADGTIADEIKDMIAMINGKRELYNGVALNTQFCMSNPKAREIVAKYIVNYSKLHDNVDYLHVWLADASANHCECKSCREKFPSDWYVILLNEIDELLTVQGLNTRIVFICYTDTTWAPIMEKLKNPDRFSFMLAAITRTYTTCVPKVLPDLNLNEFKHNNRDNYPKAVEEYLGHAQNWRKVADCPSLVYEYHFWLHQYRDPGMMYFSKLIHEDVKGYYANGFNGLIEDGSQRSYFPNGFNYFVYAETLFDVSVDYDELKETYFKYAYGEAKDDVIAYLGEITDACDPGYMIKGTAGSADYYCPEKIKKLKTIREITAKYAEIFKKYANMPRYTQSVAMRMLKIHMEYCNGISDAWALKAGGHDAEAKASIESLRKDFGKYEREIATYFDQFMCFSSLIRAIGSPRTFYEIV